MKRSRIVNLLAVLTFLATTIGAYSVTNVLAENNSSPPDNGRSGGIITPAVEDAENVAGYKAATPSFLPQGFERGSTFVGFRPNVESESKTITQYWGPQSGEFILLLQDPELDGLAGGKADTVAGVPGKRSVYPPIGSRSLSRGHLM
jgi:hypothetical protein